VVTAFKFEVVRSVALFARRDSSVLCSQLQHIPVICRLDLGT
jgi:hypothetical protein